MISRCFRFLATSVVAAAIALAPSMASAQAKVLKISHQFPTATGDDGDFRDRLAKNVRGRSRKADEW